MEPLGLLPSPTELRELGDVRGLQRWAGLSGAAWAALEAQLGPLPGLPELGRLPRSKLAAAAAAASVPRAGGGEAGRARRLTAVERAQVELMWMVAKQQLGVPSTSRGAADARKTDEEADDVRPGGAVGSRAPTAAQAKEVAASLTAACRSGDPGQLQRAISEARAAGLAAQTREAAAVLGEIVARRDREQWRVEAAQRLKVVMSGEIDIGSLEHAINRGWHAGVEKALIDEAVALFRRTKRQRRRRARELRELFQRAQRTRRREDLLRVVAEAGQLGLGAEAFVASDMLAELEDAESAGRDR